MSVMPGCVFFIVYFCCVLLYGCRVLRPPGGASSISLGGGDTVTSQTEPVRKQLSGTDAAETAAETEMMSTADDAERSTDDGSEEKCPETSAAESVTLSTVNTVTAGRAGYTTKKTCMYHAVY